MERFNRVVHPEEFSEEDLVYLRGLLGTTRTVSAEEDATADATADKKNITFVSILSIRELTILYNAILDGTPVVAKVAIKYEVLQQRESMLEEICFDHEIELEDGQWDKQNEKWNLTEEQEQFILPKLEEAIKTFKYTDTFIKDVQLEAFFHENLKNCDFVPKYYGLFYCEDIVIYVIEKLGKDLFRERPPLEKVAIDVIKALECLHTTDVDAYIPGYLHRDVTPGNILNNDRGGVCLIDFGVTSLAANCRHPGKEKKKYSLTVGNPAFAPSIAFLGCYNYAADLEGLVYTLEVLYSGEETIPWGILACEGRSEDDKGVWRDELSERAYLLRQGFVPRDKRVKKLLEYIQTIGNEMPDYQKCIGFFL